MSAPQAIRRERLHNQHLAAPSLRDPAQLVRALGAVQAQDFGAAKWAVGLRLVGATDAAIDHALATFAIVRTHVLRPTWHFVHPADLRWMLELSAPRIHKASAAAYREFGIDAQVLTKSHGLLARALAGKQTLTRAELALALTRGGVDGRSGQRMGHLLMAGEVDGVICSGGRRGKQMTYALLEEHVPRTKRSARAEALVALADRYFTSRGPATLADFAWWSGLRTADARAAIEGAAVTTEVIDGHTYWRSTSRVPAPARDGLLLPNYDEYIVGYQDRRAIIDADEEARSGARGNVLFQHTLVVDGRVVGTWRRTTSRTGVVVAATPFGKLTRPQLRALTDAAGRLGSFLEAPVTVQGL